MKEFLKDFSKNYFTNFFIIWGFILIITGQANHIEQIYDFREFIWTNFIHIVIFWMIVTFTGIHIYAPFWEGLKQLSRRNNGLSLFIISGFMISIAAEVPLFFIGILEMITVQHEGTINDQITFSNSMSVIYSISYFLLPMSASFFIYKTKKEFQKKINPNYKIMERLSVCNNCFRYTGFYFCINTFYNYQYRVITLRKS